ncbi:hypothetical protein FQR65_LT15030 [Abscondita terminalis]|nr:hypothetical protein FQR65_LT15030 [Abscondita terminalis]
MSFEEIISEIQAKPEMWLSSHSLYKNRIVKAKVLRELASKLKIEGKRDFKKRWKHLKDQYRKELKKQPICRSGAESDDWESTWQYFGIMSFVKDEIVPAPSTGNLQDSQTSNTHETESTNNDLYDLDSETTGSVTSPLPLPSPVESSSSQASSRKRTSIKDDLLEIEKKKLSLMEKRLTETDNTII